jgi:hypothetical protein
VQNVNVMPQFSTGFAASLVQAHMANRAKQPEFLVIPGDFQPFCEDFELFWESLGEKIETDDHQKLHVFNNYIDETNAKIRAKQMLSGSNELSYPVLKN